MLDTAVILYRVHRIRIDLSHKRTLIATVNISSSVIVNKHARIDEPAVTAYLIGYSVLVF